LRNLKIICRFVEEITNKTIEIMNNIVKTIVNLSDLQIGMTVEHNNKLYTVGKESLSKNEHGISFNGDSSKKTITRVQFAVPTASGIVLR
jgi:hypothetical protein